MHGCIPLRLLLLPLRPPLAVPVVEEEEAQAPLRHYPQSILPLRHRPLPRAAVAEVEVVEVMQEARPLRQAIQRRLQLLLVVVEVVVAEALALRVVVAEAVVARLRQLRLQTFQPKHRRARCRPHCRKHPRLGFSGLRKVRATRFAMRIASRSRMAANALFSQPTGVSVCGAINGGNRRQERQTRTTSFPSSNFV